jgi:hypothetical protein
VRFVSHLVNCDLGQNFIVSSSVFPFIKYALNLTVYLVNLMEITYVATHLMVSILLTVYIIEKLKRNILKD